MERNYCNICCFILGDSEITKWFSVLFTVKIDPRNISNSLIKFRNKNDLLGFTVVESIDEYHRRAIAWFYRNYDSPNINEWNIFLQKFKFDKVPYHKLQMWEKDGSPSSYTVTILALTKSYIQYSVNNEIIDLPIGSGVLLPNNYIYNFKKNINK